MFSFADLYASGSHWCVRLILCKTKWHFSLGPAGRAASVVHMHSCSWQRPESRPCKDTSVFGTERFPLLTLSCKTERPLLELPGPGPQGECKSLSRDRNGFKLSFHPPKCQLDLWREEKNQCLPSCWGRTGPLGAWLPPELHRRCSAFQKEGHILQRKKRYINAVLIHCLYSWLIWLFSYLVG